MSAELAYLLDWCRVVPVLVLRSGSGAELLEPFAVP